MFIELVSQTLFEFKDYRQYLNEALPTRGPERGSRARLAAALGVQKGFISSMLYGSAELGLEQAFKVSQFLQHSSEERDFFMLLVQLARAGSVDLEKYFRKKIDQILLKRREIRERVVIQEALAEVDQCKYYASWHPIAVHMCLRIPELNSPSSISRYLEISISKVEEVLAFLVRVGLAQKKGSAYHAGPTRIHLPSDSPLISQHHTHWRMQAVQSLDRPRSEDLHYSSVMSISSSAAEVIRANLLESIQNMEPVIRDAKDEGVYVLVMDLFKKC
jgi:uncharacterized protein (TIGR02147 family)